MGCQIWYSSGWLLVLCILAVVLSRCIRTGLCQIALVPVGASITIALNGCRRHNIKLEGTRQNAWIHRNGRPFDSSEQQKAIIVSVALYMWMHKSNGPASLFLEFRMIWIWYRASVFDVFRRREATWGDVRRREVSDMRIVTEALRGLAATRWGAHWPGREVLRWDFHGWSLHDLFLICSIVLYNRF
jgi:hypothetical protein